MTFEQLRRQHPELIYQNYHYQLQDNSLVIEFEFMLKPDIKFQPQVVIRGINHNRCQKIDKQPLDNWIFHLGLAEIPSYWKAACPPLITIKAGSLDKFQQDWWQDLLIKGLGEFFYQNQIDFTQPDLVKFQVSDTNPSLPANSGLTYPHPYLVPVGGGKDSSLVLGLLDKNNFDYGCLHLTPQSPAAEKIAAISRCQQSIIANRSIDPQLLKLNEQGYLNGHTPFSSYLSFLSVLTAHLLGYRQILTGSEHSANQGNVNYLKQTINHQYSKSFTYEQKFRNYSRKYLQVKLDPGLNTNTKSGSDTDQTAAYSPQAEYLSVLRPLNELQIAALFAQFDQYHPIFRSCNQNQQQGSWCHHCPKCLFVFTSLFPFIEQEKLCSQIFSSNLFDDETLVETAVKLADPKQCKPFECVGTFQESTAAFYLSTKKYQTQSQPLPPVLAAVNQKVLADYTQAELEELTESLLKTWHSEHHLPPQLTAILKPEL